MGNHEPSIFSTTAGWWWLHTGRVASQSMSLIQTDNHVYSVHSKFACIALKCKQEPVTMQSQFPLRMPFWFFSQFSQQDKDFVFVNCPSEALICLMLALGFGWPSEHQSATNDNTNVYRSPNKPFLKYIYIYLGGKSRLIVYIWLAKWHPVSEEKKTENLPCGDAHCGDPWWQGSSFTIKTGTWKL